MSLQVEEDSWMEEMLKRCCENWPPAELTQVMSSTNLDDVLKTEPTVSVSQVSTAG